MRQVVLSRSAMTPPSVHRPLSAMRPLRRSTLRLPGSRSSSGPIAHRGRAGQDFDASRRGRGRTRPAAAHPRGDPPRSPRALRGALRAPSGACGAAATWSRAPRLPPPRPWTSLVRAAASGEGREAHREGGVLVRQHHDLPHRRRGVPGAQRAQGVRAGGQGRKEEAARAVAEGDEAGAAGAAAEQRDHRARDRHARASPRPIRGLRRSRCGRRGRATAPARAPGRGPRRKSRPSSRIALQTKPVTRVHGQD